MLNNITKIAYVSDFFLSDLKGGAEFVDNTIITYLKQKTNITLINTNKLTIDILDNFDFFIISNISLAAPDIVDYLSTKKYIIIEHDYKFIQSRWIPVIDVISKERRLPHFIKLYDNAIKTFVQTEYHKKVFEQNEITSNFDSLDCSIWSEDELNLLELTLTTSKKTKQFCIVDSDSFIKGTKQAMQFCELNKIKYDLIKSPNYVTFVSMLAEYQNLIFFPVLAETCSRLAVEARCLGCNVISHAPYGANTSDWFTLDGKKLITYLNERSKQNLKSIEFSLWK
jgi:hypothetical protein